MVKLKVNDTGSDSTKCGTVIEVFDDPKAPIAYVEFAGEARRWIFVSDLEAVHVPDRFPADGQDLRPPA